MNKMIISIAIALAFCTFDFSGAALRGVKITNGCICSFLTVSSCAENTDGSNEDDRNIEYSFKLYEIIKELFE